jgi:hypothetical protein
MRIRRAQKRDRRSGSPLVLSFDCCANLKEVQSNKLDNMNDQTLGFLTLGIVVGSVVAFILHNSAGANHCT